jgi:DNA gyrase subunit A
VTDSNDLMIINRSGLIIRLAVSDLRVMGRATQGVRLINLKDEDSIAAVAKVEVEEDEMMDENGTNDEMLESMDESLDDESGNFEDTDSDNGNLPEKDEE